MAKRRSKKNASEASHTQPTAEFVLTGAVLVGGAKLIYEAGKDIAAHVKSGDEIFLQLLGSDWRDDKHIVLLRIASSHVHSTYIESFVIGKKERVPVFEDKEPRMGIKGANDVENSEPLPLPHLLVPGTSIDLRLEFGTVTNKQSKKKGGTTLTCTFWPLDKLDAPKTIKANVRLIWPNKTDYPAPKSDATLDSCREAAPDK